MFAKDTKTATNSNNSDVETNLTGEGQDIADKTHTTKADTTITTQISRNKETAETTKNLENPDTARNLKTDDNSRIANNIPKDTRTVNDLDMETSMSGPMDTKEK